MAILPFPPTIKGQNLYISILLQLAIRTVLAAQAIGLCISITGDSSSRAECVLHPESPDKHELNRAYQAI